MVPYYCIGRIVQQLLAGTHSFAPLRGYFIMLAVFWTLRVVFHSFSTSCSHVATFAVLGNIRKAMIAKLVRVPLGDVQNIPSGALKNVIVERVDSMETTLAHILPEFTANIAAPLLIFIYLLTINWKLALASLITLPVGLLCMASMMSGQAEQWANCVEKTKILNDTAVEYINGIEVIKAFGKADSSYEKFKKAARDGANCYIDWMRRSIVPFTAAFVIAPATMLAVLPAGGMMYLHGSVAAADLVMVIILASGLITPFLTIMSYNDDMTKAGTIFEEVDAILHMQEMKRPEKSAAVPQDNTIVMEDVHFAYRSGPKAGSLGTNSRAGTAGDQNREILHGVSLTFRDGTVNALVGPSGSGKTTIARLIASLWDVDAGSITLGGVNIRDISQTDYSRRIAFVSQDNYLFNRSVRDNIRMGRADASDAEVEEAAKRCGCHDFIMGLENGYDTVVGDAGGHLSGGERQRISIARAMLKDADIIILDEATSFTDPENEALIQQSVASMIRNKTLIVIAHRLSTVTDADQIVVINDGSVHAAGTHEELLAADSLYRNMWEAHIAARDTAEEKYEKAAEGEEHAAAEPETERGGRAK